MRVVTGNVLDIEAAVRERYSRAAGATEAELCCPVTYDPALPEAIPDEDVPLDHRQAVIYRGPFREVVDDDGHVLRPGALLRSPRETKGADYDVTTESSGPGCGETGGCC